MVEDIREILRETLQLGRRADKLDAFLEFNERDLLTHAGKVQMQVAQKLAEERYEVFDVQRRRAEVVAADKEDISELEIVVQKFSQESITKNGGK